MLVFLWHIIKARPVCCAILAALFFNARVIQTLQKQNPKAIKYQNKQQIKRSYLN